MNEELSEEVKKVIGEHKVENVAVEVLYKNYRGETGLRKIIPVGVYYGNNEYHPEVQWILKVWDLEKQAFRDYALKDILEWKKFPEL